MDKVGTYVEYEGERYIVCAFDGTFYYLVSEIVAKTHQVDGDLFVLVTEEELTNDENLEI